MVKSHKKSLIKACHTDSPWFKDLEDKGFSILQIEKISDYSSKQNIIIEFVSDQYYFNKDEKT